MTRNIIRGLMSLRHASSHIPVKAYDTYERGVGLINDSRKARSTEIDAIMRMRWGDPVPATDAIGDALRAGKIRCPRCNQYQEPRCFATWKNPATGKTYQKTLCNSCRKKLEKAKHIRELELPSPYPDRLR